jgi:hypothetical protein
MVDGYEKIEFPQIRSDFSDTKIYWRGSGDSVPIIKEAEAVKDLHVNPGVEETREEPTELKNQSEMASDLVLARDEKEQKLEDILAPVEEPTSTIQPTSAPENKSGESPKPSQPLIIASHPTPTEEWTVIDAEISAKEPQPNIVQPIEDTHTDTLESETTKQNEVEEPQTIVKVQRPY